MTHSRRSGGKPTFLTSEATQLESFKIDSLTGREEGLAPAERENLPCFVIQLKARTV
jgi:hypothetical protein